MAAPDKKRIIASCIYAATGLTKPTTAVALSESDDEDSETSTEKCETDSGNAEVLWGDLTADQQQPYLDVAGHLHSFTAGTAVENMDCAIAAKSVFDLFGVGWAATAAHIFKNVAMEFSNIA